MTVPARKTAALFRGIEESSALAREAALHELEALRKDLGTLEGILKGRKTRGNFSPFDVVHGAFELFRHASAIFEHQDLLTRLEEGLETAKAEESLERFGARLLKKPEGWHWISPKGEMHFLAKAGEAEKALGRLNALRAPRKKQSASSSAPPEETM